MNAPNRYVFLGCAVDACSQTEAVDQVRELAKGDKPSCVMFLNVDVIVKSDRNAKLREMTHRSALTLMDGKPPLKVARKKGVPLPEKVSGSDLVPAICDMAAKEQLSVFFLGGKEGVPEAAVANAMSKYPGLMAVGAYSPPFGFEKSASGREQLVERVRNVSPNIVFLCLGCPKQEEVAYDLMDDMGVPCMVCAGATVDFIAGNVERAPVWVSQVGLEWLYRFFKEPKRLFKRYFIDSWHFLAMLMRKRDAYES